MVFLIAAGQVWRYILGGKRAETIRSHLARSVYDLFLPALVLLTLWQSEVDINTVKVPLVAACTVLLSLSTSLLVHSRMLQTKQAVGAMVLAGGFGNFTYLGLPVLTHTFGPWAQTIAVQFDLFASTPLLFSLGIYIAKRHGERKAESHPLIELAKVPPLWAALLGLFLSLLHIPIPSWLEKGLTMLAGAVIPLMLVAVGMALRWQAGWQQRLPLLLPVAIIQLLLMPAFAWAMAEAVHLPPKMIPPVVIEGGMPTMVLGLVICDRFKLDSALYAEAVTITTALALLTLPLWLSFLPSFTLG